MAIVDWFTSRARTTLSLLVLLVIWGAASYATIPVSAEPEITVPFISVTSVLRGASAEDIVNLVTRPIETELSNLDGVVEVFSYSSIGASTVVVEFNANFDPDDATDDVRQAVDNIRSELPNSIEEPGINDFNTRDFPLITLALYSETADEDVLIATAEQLEEELEKLPQIQDAEIKGEQETVVEILVDKERLESYGLPMSSVFNTVTQNNTLIQAGVQDTGHGRFAVKVPALIKSYKDLQTLPVKVVQGTVVTLGDVTTIRRAFKDRNSFSSINGQRTISLDLVLKDDSNDIETSDAVRALTAQAEALLPPGVVLTIANDDSDWARDMVSELTGNIVTAVVLVMTLVVAFLGLRAGALVGLGIPVSFLIGFLVLKTLGLSLNFMVMFGLLLSMGMLIDGSIVVVELADRYRKANMSLFDAYTGAAKRMFWPIVASAATTLAAFIPLMVWPGVTGKFMRYLPITVFSVLGASLLYSLVFTPTLGIVLGSLGRGKKAAEGEEQPSIKPSNAGEQTSTGGIFHYYERLMNWACRSPLFVVLSIFLLLLVIVRAWTTFGAGTSYFVTTDPQYAGVKIKTRGNFSISEQERLTAEVQGHIADLPEIETLYTNSGGGSRASFAGTRGGSAEQISNIFVELVPSSDRELGGFEVFDVLRERLADIPGMLVQVAEFRDGPPIGAALEVSVLSSSLETAREGVILLKEFVSGLPGLQNVESTLEVAQIEWQVLVDRPKAAAAGASLQEIGAAVQLVTQGIRVDEYLPDDARDEVEILVRFAREQRTLNQLDRLLIQTPQGLVPLSSFVTVQPKASVELLSRSDEKYNFKVTAGLASDQILISDKVQAINEWQAAGHLPDNTQLRFGGAQEAQQETVLFLFEAAGVALFLMLILLITQFNSFYQAALILSAVAMSVAGVLLMMLLTQTVMSVVMGGMGLVTLAGVVVNNNIVLIDNYNYIRKHEPGLTIQQAAIKTGLQRLRPVLLTTVTTVFGLLPLAFGVSVDLIDRTIEPGSRVASYWTQLASTLASGLSFSTILTLIFVPAALVLPSYLRMRFSRFAVSLRRLSSAHAIPLFNRNK